MKNVIYIFLFISMCINMFSQESLFINSNDSQKLKKDTILIESWVKLETGITYLNTLQEGKHDASQLLNDIRIRFFNVFSIEGGISFIPESFAKLGINFHVNDLSISIIGLNYLEKPSDVSSNGGIWFGYMPIKSKNDFDFFSRIGFLRNRTAKEFIYNTIALEIGLKYNIN